jgi:hypothetical protein
VENTKSKKKKRTYQTPRITQSEPFERLALACNGNQARQPIKGNEGACTSVGAS